MKTIKNNDDMEHKWKCPPIMICGFNRPDCLRQVFGAVRKVKPQQLFLVLDAPRPNRSDDKAKCDACRKVFENVDWSCDVHRNYAERNMGCRGRMSSGITWVFRHVDRAIILEDDCLPDLTFFQFCDELLERYAKDDRVGMIAGHVEYWKQAYEKRLHLASYYFDRMNTIWGWATWRRAWEKYESNVLESKWEMAVGQFEKICVNRRQLDAFVRIARSVAEGRCNSWAFVWGIACLQNNMLCIHPVKNLVTNIGYGMGATHTTAGSESPWSRLPMSSLTFPLTHPRRIEADIRNEQRVINGLYAPSFGTRCIRKASRIINHFLRNRV